MEHQWLQKENKIMGGLGKSIWMQAASITW